MSLLNDLFILLVFLFFYMTFWFGVSVTLRRNDIADVAWGAGFIGLAWLSFNLGQSRGPYSLLISSLVTLWGVRLTWHILLRVLGKGEDQRYAAWREKWGRALYWRSFWQIFMLQGVLMFMIASPVMLINLQANAASPLSLWSIFLAAFWLMGFIIEAVADYQLRCFIHEPKNKGLLMRQGVWQYSRHPNYFGEICQWWALGGLALSVPWGWVGLISPLLLTYLIVKVSGIPMLEAQMASKPGFKEYQAQTSMLIPWFKNHTPT